MLTTLQQRQLDELSDWLRRMEALVSEDVSDEPLQNLLEKHQVFDVVHYSMIFKWRFSLLFLPSLQRDIVSAVMFVWRF